MIVRFAPTLTACPAGLGRWDIINRSSSRQSSLMSKAAKRKARSRRPEARRARAQVVPEAAPPPSPAVIERDISTNEPLLSTERSIFPYVVSVLLLLPAVYWGL